MIWVCKQYWKAMMKKFSTRISKMSFLCLRMFFVLFQIAASNYFFPHWLQENQSPNWKTVLSFHRLLSWKVSTETFLLRFFRRLHWNIRRQQSLPRIMMSNLNPRYRQSVTSLELNPYKIQSQMKGLPQCTQKLFISRCKDGQDPTKNASPPMVLIIYSWKP